MAGAYVEVKIDDSRFKRSISELLARLVDTTPLMAEIGEIVVESVQRNFEEKQAPDGTPWKPLAPATVRARAKKGRSAEDILIFNRILMGSVHPEAHRDHVDIGTNIVYAAVHQFGIGAYSHIETRRTMPAIPARPYLGVREEDWPEIDDAIGAFITQGVT